MLIAHSAQKLSQELDSLRLRAGQRRCVSMVTTKGGFHDGHGAVMNAAKTLSDVVVVVIAPGALERHDTVISAPEFQDIGYVEQHEVDLLFLPGEEELFPLGYDHTSMVHLPAADNPLNADPYRLTLHLKLINLVQPDIVLWGEKNFVEYHQVRRMVTDLDIRTQVQCVPTIRHADGTVVSSEFEHLDADTQAVVPILYETLQNTAHAIRTGARNYNKIENTARLALREAGFEIQRFCILDEAHLQPADAQTATFRILGEVSLGDLHLSDSIGCTL
ncbi:MAG: pantoate--beta-alanine ligase [Pseudomonadota bacterium]